MMATTLIRPAGALFTVLLLLANVLTGCQSGSFSYYTSPRVTGRVLDADTRQPLADVKVQRMAPYPNTDPSSLPKGGQVMTQRTLATWTDADGGFTLDSERIVALFRRPGWYTITVSFGRPGYEHFQTNFNASVFKERTPEGVPLVPAGDIWLRPGTK